MEELSNDERGWFTRRTEGHCLFSLDFHDCLGSSFGSSALDLVETTYVSNVGLLADWNECFIHSIQLVRRLLQTGWSHGVTRGP